jgi:hypothetical protein
MSRVAMSWRSPKANGALDYAATGGRWAKRVYRNYGVGLNATRRFDANLDQD